MKLFVLALATVTFGMNALAESYTYEDPLRQRAAEARNPHHNPYFDRGNYGAPATQGSASRNNHSSPTYRYPSNQGGSGYSYNYGSYQYRSHYGAPRR